MSKTFPHGDPEIDHQILDDAMEAVITQVAISTVEEIQANAKEIRSMAQGVKVMIDRLEAKWYA